MPWLWLVATGAVALLIGRLRDLSDGRRLWRNADDPTFQGDGWRWTLSLLLPHLPLPIRLVGRDGRTPMGTVARIMQADHGIAPPFGLDMLPLTTDQRLACWAEWDSAMRTIMRLGRPLERWETIDREERGG